ncbi:PREDICTED: uncharacterized protein LOC108576089 [Habropoda laboriosa]|uniref:uncharacterized protein LOC108576089 n=1 Tax=Habropoda laboriosa TaxID=597456 RepID=UPI00083E5FC3|nr:PREDICTED: uncharacterized protein LOC108576089 [Habropoda laboriosa]
MDFQSLSQLNMLINKYSGNQLPMTDKKTKLPYILKSYSIMSWLIQLTYLTVCVFGLFNVPRDKALKDGTVNIVVALEEIVLVIYLHNRKTLVRRLIGELNRVLAVDNEMLRNVTINTVKSLEKPLKIYTIASVNAVMLWTALPLVQVFRRSEFYYTDYSVPAALSKQPFSYDVFVGGVVLQIIGGVYTVMKKIGVDIYTMHLILLMTAQYKYIRGKVAMTFRQYNEAFDDFGNSITGLKVSCEKQKVIKQEMRSASHHYEVIVKMTIMLKKLLSPNIGILYVNNVFRFCFLSLMIITNSGDNFEKLIIVMYTIGALTQFYVLCFCIQELVEASTSVADDVVHERWYFCDVLVQRVIAMIILADKMECRLSSFRNIDLTLPSFMSILNQAYSTSLLFLKAK